MEKKVKKLDLWKILLFVGIWIFGLLLGSRLVMAFWPHPELDAFITRPVTTRYLDRAGQLVELAKLPGGVQREAYLLKEYPETIIKTVLAAEDRNYYFHPGVDPIGLFNGTGGRTLTMQVARLIHQPSPDFWGSLTEIIDALRLEAKLDKGRILELYLNNVPFAPGIEGFASASRFYFGKAAPDLLPEEAAMLSTLHHDPDGLSPLTHPEEAAAAGYKAALASDFGSTVFAKTNVEDFKAAARRAKSLFPKSKAPQFMAWNFALLPEKKKGELRTSISLTLQHTSESLLRSLMSLPAAGGATQGAVLILDNRNGEILAWVSVGGDGDQVLSARDAGTILRPWLYAQYLEKGGTTARLLRDRVAGDVLLRGALQKGLAGAADELEKEAGAEALFGFLKKLNLVSLPAARSEAYQVRLYDLVLAQTLLFRGGNTMTLSPLQGISGLSGDNLLGGRTAGLLADMLKTRASSFVDNGRYQNVDTDFDAVYLSSPGRGSSPAWVVASTPEFTVGAMLGREPGQASSQTIEIRPLQRLVAAELSMIPGAHPKIGEPGDVWKAAVDSVSGGLAGADCPLPYTEYIPNGAPRPEPCEVHTTKIDRKQVRTPVPGPRGTDHPLAIVHPVNGAVYKLAGNKPADKQSVLLQASAALVTQTTVWVDGKKVGQLDTRGQFSLPAVPGQHIVELRDGLTSVSRAVYSVEP